MEEKRAFADLLKEEAQEFQARKDFDIQTEKTLQAERQRQRQAFIEQLVCTIQYFKG
jgi:hypothetical protein